MKCILSCSTSFSSLVLPNINSPTLYFTLYAKQFEGKKGKIGLPSPPMEESLKLGEVLLVPEREEGGCEVKELVKQSFFQSQKQQLVIQCEVSMQQSKQARWSICYLSFS